MRLCKLAPMSSKKPAMAAKPPRPPAPPDFEKSLAELESIVKGLEQGDLSLEESLRQFERGVSLTRVCQTALTQAEHKVEILLRTAGATGDGPAGDLSPGAEPFGEPEFAEFDTDDADDV